MSRGQTLIFTVPKQPELAPDTPVTLAAVRAPAYGRGLQDLVPGRVFVHPRGLTLTEAHILDFSGTFFECNALYRNAEIARAAGYARLPASPQLVFNTVLSLGVQNDSEQCIANLGYYDVCFLRPVLAGDTLSARTKVLDRRERGADQPGIVTLRTLGLNQRGEVVLQYDRKILVAKTGDAGRGAVHDDNAEFPEVHEPTAEVPLGAPGALSLLPTGDTFFEDFSPGDVILHKNGRSITDEHMNWTYRVGNTHPLHFDRVYSRARSGPMSGEPIVYGGLAFAWLSGLASRDTTENALWELGFTEGYHTQPVVTGDTLYALSRVLRKDAEHPYPGAGVVTFQLIGVKNVSGVQALERFGADLFMKENDKKAAGKDKIPEKIFEVERRVLVRKRPAF